MNEHAYLRRAKRRRMSEINVVPYIDVMLVLLVIFMVTAPLLAEGVKVELPEASARPLSEQEQEPLVISVDREGAYYLNIGDDQEKPIEHDVLVARIAAVHRNRPKVNVLVRGDSDASYGKVVGAMILIQKAGVENVGLVTQPPRESRRK